MNVSIEKKSAVAAQATISIEKADYEKDTIKALKRFCAQAQVPGFRKGKVPFGMAKKLYGVEAKLESINALMQKAMGEIMENKELNILGQPIPVVDNKGLDIENEDNFETKLDIALAPEVNIELNADDHIAYYDINITDEMVDNKITEIRKQTGSTINVEEAEEGDILRGTLAELGENGLPKEDGLVIEKSSIMPKYLKSDDQKAYFANAKVNDVITFNPSEAFPEKELATIFNMKEEEAKAYTGNFNFQVEEISRFEPAALDQEFFNIVCEEEDTVHNEEEFKAYVKNQMQKGTEGDSDYRFFFDLQKYCVEKVGNLEFDRELLGRIIKTMSESEDEKKEEKEITEEDIDNNIKALTWELISSKLFEAKDLKVSEQDIKEMSVKVARFQFQQYGMAQMPEEYVVKFAENLLNDEKSARQIASSCIREKLSATYKEVVTLDRKTVTLEEFKKLFEE